MNVYVHILYCTHFLKEPVKNGLVCGGCVIKQEKVRRGLQIKQNKKMVIAQVTKKILKDTPLSKHI